MSTPALEEGWAGVAAPPHRSGREPGGPPPEAPREPGGPLPEAPREPGGPLPEASREPSDSMRPLALEELWAAGAAAPHTSSADGMCAPAPALPRGNPLQLPALEERRAVAATIPRGSSPGAELALCGSLAGASKWLLEG